MEVRLHSFLVDVFIDRPAHSKYGPFSSGSQVLLLTVPSASPLCACWASELAGTLQVNGFSAVCCMCSQSCLGICLFQLQPYSNWIMEPTGLSRCPAAKIIVSTGKDTSYEHCPLFSLRRILVDDCSKLPLLWPLYPQNLYDNWSGYGWLQTLTTL